MNDARIAELLAPFLTDGHAARNHEGVNQPRNSAILSPDQLRSISIYIDLLIRWNARFNLTAVREPDEIVTRHFGESFFAARCLFRRTQEDTSAVDPGSVRAESRQQVIDFGSGAGFPGLPVKIWDPRIRLTLIEANQKKATFLREAVRSLKLTDVDVFAGRAEAFAGRQGERRHLSCSGALRIESAAGCRAGRPVWSLGGSGWRSSTGSGSRPCSRLRVVQTKPSTAVGQPVDDHRRQRTTVVNTVSICGTMAA